MRFVCVVNRFALPEQKHKGKDCDQYSQAKEDDSQSCRERMRVKVGCTEKGEVLDSEIESYRKCIFYVFLDVGRKR
jgi:hypothetical protein